MIDRHEFEVKISIARIALMLIYMVGVGVFLYTSEWEKAVLLACVIYWTNVAWFFEGKSKRMFIMLRDAKAIMDATLTDIRKKKEPVSKENT